MNDPKLTGRMPLLSEVQVHGQRLEARLTLDPERHRFLLDHRLGTLPVVPFSFSLELAAEAAILLSGGLPVEVTGARGTRWMAVEGASLEVRLEAEQVAPDRVRVRLHEGEQAFSCEVRLAPAYPEPPPPLPGLEGQPLSFQLSAEEYNQTLFHGEGLHSLCQGLSATTGGIEVGVRVPRGHHEPWVLPADTLDGAGHLTAYWLVQLGKRRFWLFPTACERVCLYAAPPPPHAELTCRLVLRGAHTADLDWLDAEGRVAMRILGFTFVWDVYPHQVYDWLLYPERDRRLSEPTADGRRPHVPKAFPDSTGGIWRRALAHRALTARERADLRWPLLDWIAAKEAAQEWALERGTRLELAQIELLPDGRGRPVLHGPGGVDRLQVTFLAEGIRLEGSPLRIPEDLTAGTGPALESSYEC